MRWLILVFATLLLFFSCKKIERINPVDGIVGVQTSAVQQLDLSSVQIGTTLQVTEEVPYVTQRGVCWSTSPNPTTANDFVAQGSGFGTFQSKITGLSGNTKYYFRSFASNEKTTVYGDEESYTIKAPIFMIKSAHDVLYTTAKIGGELIDNNGFDILEYGVFWGDSPGFSNNKSKLIAKEKDFIFNLEGLENGKTYYYRLFALTNLGISYGQELSFNTLGFNSPSLITELITNIGANTAISGGVITSNGGLPITEKGVCWSTTINTTLADNKSMEGAGTDSYTSKLDGLEDGVTYYVRAYATNSKGTSYGNEVSFTTHTLYKPSLSTNSITAISGNEAVSGGVITTDGGTEIIEKGICWGISSNPTTSDSKTKDGSGSANFSSRLTGLQESTRYYVRAYATNLKGTSYGNEKSFITSALQIKGVEFVNIPAGTFTMGSPSSEVGRVTDEQQHKVTLSAFKMSINEITFSQYDAFCDATGRTKPSDEGWGRGNRPVINVSWGDAKAFADWMGCRLPTEAEWEYACRAGSTTPFNTGNNLTTDQANNDGNYPYNGNPKGVYLAKTQPVGSYPSNFWGLNDMHGNVWEWCSDWYDFNYSTSNQTNPKGPNTGTIRVVRGGSWFDGALHSRSSRRSYSIPSGSKSGIGFRIVFP